MDWEMISASNSSSLNLSCKWNLHVIVAHCCLELLRKCPTFEGLGMCKLGRSKAYTTQLPRTGLSQIVVCTKVAEKAFLISVTSP